MKKFGVALISALALTGLTAGAANADCPPVAKDTKDSTGTPVPGTTLEVDTSLPTLSVYGQDPLGQGGSGESVVTVGASSVSYDGQIEDEDIGYGDVEGSVGTGGVSGSADGQVAGVSGSGHVGGGHVSAGSNLVPCTTIP